MRRLPTPLEAICGTLLAITLIVGCPAPEPTPPGPSPVVNPIGEMRRTEARLIADGLDRVARQIESGEIKSAKQAEDEMAAAVKSARAEAYDPFLKTLQTTQDPPTIARYLRDYATQYRELSR